MGRVVKAMTSFAAVDTHALIWLYEENAKAFSSRGREMLEASHIIIPSFVWLELVMMEQKGRLGHSLASLQSFIAKTLTIRALKADISKICRAAHPLTWTRDPFDRMIVAECIFHNIPLVTKDRLIRKHYKKAIW
jgi:PIN domain nuclease of toxin-antitoxin system